MVLRPSSNGGFDQRTLSVAYTEARARNDVAAAMIALGCPAHIARRAAAHHEIHKELPNADRSMQHRLGEQRLLIKYGETAAVPSEAEIRARVAAVGLQIARERRG